MSVHHADLDRQHQELFALFQQLEQQIGQGKSPQELAPFIAFLEQSCQEHFQFESNLLTEKKILRTDEHFWESDRFLMRMRQIYAHSGTQFCAPLPLPRSEADRNPLQSLLQDHICRFQMLYGDRLRKASPEP